MEHSKLRKKTIDKEIAPHAKLANINIPESSDTRLIIPCNPSGYGFLLLDQETEYIKDVPSKKINKTLRLFNKQIDKLIIQKKVEETTDYNASHLSVQKGMFALSVLVSLTAYLMTIYEVDNFKESLVYIFVAGIFAINIFSIVFAFKGLISRRHFIVLDVEVNKALDAEIEKENYSYYQQRGYIIEKGRQFSWIAIKKVF